MSVPQSAVKTEVVMAATQWPTNGHMIADVARLGYLRAEWLTLDPTYGLGRWWTVWRPDKLEISDLHTVDPFVDFRDLPCPDGTYEAVAFDPPYKLNGTPTATVDGQYGVDKVASRSDRTQLILDGIKECSRVLAPNGTLLVKCQDQVNGGKVRWQSIEFASYAMSLGLVLVDQLVYLNTPRPQPPRSRLDGVESVQQHARRNYSTLLIFEKPRRANGQVPLL